MSATMVPVPSEPHSTASPNRRVFGEKPFRTDADVLALSFAGAAGLWSLEEGGALRRWDCETGRLLSWEALGDIATLWTFRPDGQILAGADGDLRLWDVASGQQRTVIPQDSWVTAVAFAPNGDLAATGHDDGRICLWDTSDGQLLLQLRGHQKPISALAFHPKGSQLASAAEDRLILVWDVDEGRILGLLAGHTDRIPALAWHPDGQRLFSAGWDTTARVWDVDTFEPIILLNSHANQVTAMALSADGALLACADSANVVHIWDVATNCTLHVFDDAGAEIRCLAFNADGTRLAAGGADRFLHLWEPRLGKRCGGRAEPPGAETGVSLSPTGERLATVSGTTLRLWDTGVPQIVFEHSGQATLHAVAHSPDGRLLAMAGDAVELWDTTTGGRRLVLEGPKPPLSALAFASDGSLLAAAGADSADVWLWHPRTGEAAVMIPDAVPGCLVQALVFHPHQPLLAVGGCDWFEASGSDGVVIIWDVTARRRVALLGGGAVGLAFDPSGRRLAIACLDRAIRVWDVPGRRLLGEWTGHADAVRSVLFSPDGRWLASGSDDRTVRLWDAKSGQTLGLAEMPTRVQSLCFAPDGQSLFTGNGNDSCSQLPIHDLFTFPADGAPLADSPQDN
jgi:WD40 repeat protein